MSVLLSLDYSTSAVGWAKFSLDTNELLAYGVILPDFKVPRKAGVPVLAYPQAQVLKLRRLSEQIMELIDDSVTKIVVEEVNNGKNRLGQKILSGGHFVLLEKMPQEVLQRVTFVDSDGADGWRSKSGLGLQLTAADKDLNKRTKQLNKKLDPKTKKFPLITQKTLACRWVNKHFGLNLDENKRKTDGDIADAIGLGAFYLKKLQRDSSCAPR